MIITSSQVGIKGKLCTEAMALTYNRNREFPVDPRLKTVVFKRKRPVGRPRAPGLALSRTPPRVRQDAYVRNGQEVEEYPRMDLEDVNVDELGEGETSEDEPLGAEDDLGNGGEVGGDRQFFEEGEVQAGDIQEELMEAQEDLGNEDGFGGDREQEEEEQPRRFGRRWVTTG